MLLPLPPKKEDVVQKLHPSGHPTDGMMVAAVSHLLSGTRIPRIMVAEFTEVESGKKSDRPELIKALALCRVHKATLVIAKLDRLARNVAFISNLMESKTEFVAVDFPQANRLTIHVLAAVAEYEALAISTRTKAALAVAKANGKQLGGDRGHRLKIR